MRKGKRFLAFGLAALMAMTTGYTGDLVVRAEDMNVGGEIESSDSLQDDNVSVLAETSDWNVKLNDAGDGIVIGGYTGSAEDVEIPESLEFQGENYPVTEIDEEAFYDTSINSVKISSTVQKIGSMAFQSCGSLKNVDFSEADSLEIIEDQAFASDDALESIKIPGSVSTIGEGAFGWNNSLVTIDLSNATGLKTIGKQAFYSTAALEIRIPASVESIGECAFKNSSLKSIYVYGEPGSVAEEYCTQYGDSLNISFRNTNGLYWSEKDDVQLSADESTYQIKLDWPKSMEDVAWTSSDEAVATVDENGLVTRAKKGTVTITVTRGDLSKSMELTFSGTEEEEAEIRKLWSYSFNEDTQTIEIGKYYGDAEEVVVPERIKYDGHYYRVSKIGYYALSRKNLKKVIIPASVTEIGERAFSNCSNLQTVKLEGTPELTTIGDSAFSRCTSLEKINIEDAAQLQKISTSAFYGNSSLTSISIPENVENIMDSAFLACTNLADIRFPDNGKLENIGDSAFNNVGATEIHVPFTVQKIGRQAFIRGICKKLYLYGEKGSAVEAYCDADTTASVNFRDEKGIYLNEKDEIEIPFDESTYQIKVEWPKSMDDMKWTSSEESVATVDGNGLVTRIGKGTTVIKATRGEVSKSIEMTFQGNPEEEEQEKIWSMTWDSEGTGIRISKYNGDSEDIVIPEILLYAGKYYKVTEVGSYAFAENNKIKTLKVSKNLQKIEEKAFATCTNLESVDMSEATALTEIGEGAFREADSLKTIVIPENVQVIGARAFRDCKKLETVDLSDASNLTEIREGAFNQDTELKSVLFSTNIQKIESMAFAGCSNLTEIDLSKAENLTEIGKNAFASVGATEIQLPPSIQTIGENAFYRKGWKQLYLYGENGSVVENYCKTTDNNAVFRNLNGVYLNEENEIEVTSDKSNYQIKLDWPKDLKDVQWTSSDEMIAKVDEKGLVNKVQKGTVTITATRGNENSSLVINFAGDAQEDAEDAENWSASFRDDGTLKIYKYNGNALDVIIPYVLKMRGRYYKVSEVGYYAFANNKNIKKVTISGGIKEIDERAFNRCTNLENVDLTEAVNLETIGESAFCRCSNLNDVDFKGAIKLSTIKTGAFWGTGATEFQIPSTVQTIEKNAFAREDFKRLYLYGAKGSAAEAYCGTTTSDSMVIFRDENGIYLEDLGNGGYVVMDMGETLALKVMWPKNISSDEIKWISSNDSIAAVDKNGVITANDAGYATITVDRNGYTEKVEVQVVKKDLTKASVKLENSSYSYTGKSIVPKVTVKDGNVTLKKDKDYKITYSNNVKVGTAKVIVKGIGIYEGTVSKTFVIAPKVSYRTQSKGASWQSWSSNGAVNGIAGKSKRLEKIQVKLSGGTSIGIRYRACLQNKGWQIWVENGSDSGLRDVGIEAIQMKLYGTNAKKYDVYYRVYAQDYGWLNWAKNGSTAGTGEVYKRMEAIQIVVVAKGSAAPGTVSGITSKNKLSYIHKTHKWDSGKVIKKATSYTQNGTKKYTCTACGTTKTVSYAKAYPVDVTYKTQVQSYGWQKTVKNGAIGGIVGKSKRMEAIAISTKNLTDKSGTLGISYNTYVQSTGWQGKTGDVKTWKKNGQTAGTVGKGKRLEAIQIKLTGTNAKKYDVYYRVNMQNYGWLGWAKNGQAAGAAGKGKRIEAIQIIIVEKGAKINTSLGGIKSATSKATK